MTDKEAWDKEAWDKYYKAETADVAGRYGSFKCADCIYWFIDDWRSEMALREGKEIQGNCRRRAPIAADPELTAIGELLGLIAWAAEETANIKHAEHAPYDFVGHGDVVDVVWPYTKDSDWCGEGREGRKPMSAETIAELEALHDLAFPLEDEKKDEAA